MSKKYLGDEINNFRPRTIQILSWVSKVDSGVKAEEIYSEIISKKHQFHDIEIAQILYILGFYQLSKSLQEEGQQYLKKSKVHFENLRIKNYSFETALSTINDQLDNGM